MWVISFQIDAHHEPCISLVYYIDFCRISQFNSDFPRELIEIIDPYEFKQSIANINRARRSTSCEILLSLISILGLLVILMLIIIAACLVSVDGTIWIPILFIGGGIMLLTTFICIFVRVWRASVRETRLKNAVNEESMKYSTKRSVPTRWRLHKETIAMRNLKGTSTYKYYLVSNTFSTSHIMLIV